jgi:predicted DNA-binding transcriptional regulator
VFDNFERSKIEILTGILGYKRDDLADVVYDSCNLAVEDGGLGFYRAEDIASAAYLASVGSFSRSEDGKSMKVWDKMFEFATFGDFDEEEAEVPREMIPSYVKEVHRLQAVLKKHQPDLAQDPLNEICGWLLNLVLERKDGTVQSWLTKIQAQERIQDIKRRMNKTRLKWFIDLQTLEAGLWLRDIPKKGRGFSSPEFRAALRYRLYLPVSGYVKSSKCTCKKQPYLDECGLHLVSGCNSMNRMAETHNAIVRELANKLKWMGYVVKTEERGSFLEGEPSDFGRADVTVFGPPSDVDGPFPKLLLDVRVTNNLEGAKTGEIKVPRDADVEVKLHLSKHAYDEKIRTYKQRAHNSGCGFSPIIFMSTGGVHEESRKAILKLVKNAARTAINLSKRTLYMSLMRACSVALQKGLATAIYTRTRDVNQRLLSKASRRYQGRHYDA